MSWEGLKDANGHWAFEEIAATVHCVFTMGAAGTGTIVYLRDCIVNNHPPNLQALGVGLLAVGGAISAAIAAVGTAKKLRGDLQQDQFNQAKSQ